MLSWLTVTASPAKLDHLPKVDTLITHLAPPPAATAMSCRYLQGGLSLSFNDLRACAVIHHGRGRPILAKMTDSASFDFAALLAARDAIHAANQTPQGHPACRGCPNLVSAAWPQKSPRLTWLGITNYVYCNLDCTYCWLSYADYSPMKDTANRPAALYSSKDILDQLLRDDLISPDAIIDWGGGGEPTLNPDFDAMFNALAALGTTQWLHTNAVRIPKPIAQGTVDGSRLHILCSLDAGDKATYEIVKQRDRYDRVVKNLRQYKSLGSRIVLKYLVVAENARADLADSFVALAKDLGAAKIILDIDHRFPEPSTEITRTLFHIKSRALLAGIACKFEAVGANSATSELHSALNA